MFKKINGVKYLGTDGVRTSSSCVQSSLRESFVNNGSVRIAHI